MKNAISGLLVSTLMILVLSSNAQANPQINQTMPQRASVKTNEQIVQQFSTENKVGTPAKETILSPKKSTDRPEGNANPWAGGDSEEELRAFSGEKP